MNHTVSTEDIDYLKKFEHFEVDPSKFKHREHLRIAYILLCKFSTEEAHARIKITILEFLKHFGVGTGKYHDTLTTAWILAVKHFMHKSNSCKDFEDFIEQNKQLLDKSIMYTHYSKALIESENSRMDFIKPDLQEIPIYEVQNIQ